MANDIANWDGGPVKVTPRFMAALKELALAEIEMMSKLHGSDFWSWAKVEVGDLANIGWLRMEFGGDDDKPKGMKDQVSIEIK